MTNIEICNILIAGASPYSDNSNNNVSFNETDDIELYSENEDFIDYEPEENFENEIEDIEEEDIDYNLEREIKLTQERYPLHDFSNVSNMNQLADERMSAFLYEDLFLFDD